MIVGRITIRFEFEGELKEELKEIQTIKIQGDQRGSDLFRLRIVIRPELAFRFVHLTTRNLTTERERCTRTERTDRYTLKEIVS